MKRADQIATQYGCPKGIATSMSTTPELPLFVAVLALGPTRVQWVGAPPSRRGTQTENTTCWSLDGNDATYEEIRTAAGLYSGIIQGRPRGKYPSPVIIT